MITNQLVNVATTAALASYSYGHDAGSNIEEIIDVLDSSWSRTFNYDDLGRLVGANGGASLWGTGTYVYDDMGNLETATLGTASTAFSYNGTTPKIANVTEAGALPQTVTYDAAGNETQLGTRYTPRDHRANTHTATRVYSFGYDGRGIRVRTHSAARRLSDRFTIEHHTYTPELQMLARQQYSAGWAHTTATKTTEIVWFAGVPVAQFDGPSAPPLYTFTDHLGTPLLQTDSTAAVVWRAEYDPYGSVWTMRAGTADTQPLRFPGQEAGVDGVSHNIFRWYRGGWGRYTQADPIGLKGGTNVNRYVDDNPIRFTDRVGLVKWMCDYGYVSGEVPGAGPTIGAFGANCTLECVKGQEGPRDDHGRSGWYLARVADSLQYKLLAIDGVE